MVDTTDPRALGERWPGYNEQSWAERFATLDAKNQILSQQLESALLRQSSSTGEVTQEEDARLFREQLATLLEEDGRPKSAEAVGDEDEGIAITSGHAFKAFARHRHRFASPQTAGEVGEDKAGGLWYRRWFKASVELNEALSRVAELERENFKLAAGQCNVEGGLIGDEHGHFYCALTAERDALKHDLERQMTVANEECKRAEAALARCEEMRRALTWLGGQTRLELYHHTPTYGDDDDTAIEWRVDERAGNINDREWSTVGRGSTPIEAIESARAALGDGGGG